MPFTARTRSEIALSLLGVIRAGAGVALLLRPAQIGTYVAGGRGVAPVLIIRILGLRMLTQGLLLAARPHHQVALTVLAVDTAHAISMAGVAGLSPLYRRSALASGVEAAAAAAAVAVIGRARSTGRGRG